MEIALKDTHLIFFIKKMTKIFIMRSYSKDKEDVSGGGAIAIPKGWIKKIEYLIVSYAAQ